MENEFHIPWSNDALETLLRGVVNTGEAVKVDFKSQLSIGTAGEKAELSKDVQAFANSYDQAYRNHGFIILGAKPGSLVYATFAQNADKMQATVDQILREHLGPFVPTQVRLFGAGKDTWGVIVVPPSRNAPHVFIRDTDKFKRGDIYVRSGTTTSKAEPTDFSRFYRVQLDDHMHEVRAQLHDLQRDFAILKKQTVAPAVAPAPPVAVVDGTAAPTPPAARAETDLVGSIDALLAKAADPISTSLVREAATIRSLLDSNEIPWDLNNLTKESGRDAIDRINAVAAKFWEAIAHLIESDDEGTYDDAIIESLSDLAFDPDAPSGRSFTSFGTGIRLYPLVMALYIAFMIGARKKRDKLLRRVMGLTLSRRSYYEEPSVVGIALFLVRRADEVFQTARDEYPGSRWCDGTASYVERWVSANLFSTMPQLERNKHFFYIGEFLLVLLGAHTPNIGRPASGLFYHMSETQHIIPRFLKSEAAWLKNLFGTDLKATLQVFDAWGSKIANSGTCWGDGFQNGATAAVFPEATPEKK